MSTHVEKEDPLGEFAQETSDSSSDILGLTPDDLAGRIISSEPFVEQAFAAMAMTRSTGRVPLLAKLKPDQINKVLQLSELREKNAHELRINSQHSQNRFITLFFCIIIFGILSILFICWMFFAYGKPDQVFGIINTLIATFSAAGGGAGATVVARQLMRRRAVDTPSE